MTLIEFLRLPLKEKIKGIWLSGVKGEGEYVRCWDNGQIYEHSYYKKNELHGECKMWHPNGKLGVHYLFENGIKVKDHLK